MLLYSVAWVVYKYAICKECLWIKSLFAPKFLEYCGEIRESSFNMTREGVKILRWGGGGAPKIFRHPKEGSEIIRGGVDENLYTSKPTGGGGGGLLKIEPLARGAAKISSFQFQYLHPPFSY